MFSLTLMITNKLSLTLVGAGHYAIDLAGPLYRRSRKCTLKSVITPYPNKKPLKGTALGGLLLFNSIRSWSDSFGISNNDVFDLCIHQYAIVPVLRELAEIGANKIILPKPIAIKLKSLNEIISLQKKK